MGFSVHWSWLTAFSCLLCMGGEVRCDCTEEKIQIEGGHYTLTKQLTVGSMLIYQCPKGYYPHPYLSRHCQADGTWRKPPKRFDPQRCKLVECPDPFVLEYGNVSPPQERYFVDNETTYECYSGYTMRGSSKRVCLPNGKWSGSTPICSRDSGDNCADPGIPAGASRTGNIFEIDDTVKYSCNGNLFLVGSKERVCQENGQWSGKEPACYYRHTYDTSLEVSEAFGSAIKDSLTTFEPLDDTQEGRIIRISKNGTLDIYIAVDISASINETQVDKAKDAITTLISKISTFDVSPNYEIIFFSSEVFEVVKILDFFDEKIVLSTIIDKIKNFEVEGRNTGTDLNLLFTKFLERMSIIKLRVGEKVFKEHRHVLMIFSDGAYNMGGSPEPTVAKIKNMVYMNQTDEDKTESREDYLDIYIFAIGTEIFDEDLQRLTAGTGGSHYFRIKENTNLQEIFDSIIDEEEVKGLCGLHKDYKATEDSNRKMYPWWALVTVQYEGRLENCLGSLVTPKFILTAAHCFKFGALPEHVTVELDDGQGRVKKVKTFKLHPNYNITAKVKKGVAEFYDYDVALIQLVDDVKISSVARPICIPCTQETSNALKLVGISTCKQQEQVLFKTHLERLNFLTKTGSIVAEKEAHANLGETRGECIKHALEAPGITTRTLTDVVTDNFLCTGGSRDHIACQGDSGGAVFKNYELRTIQVALVSWGITDLCKPGDRMVGSKGNSRDFHINLFRVQPFLKSILGNDAQNDYTPLQFLSD
ncbi:complement factor B-like [Cebidichthys violaceus]|uniref:complement factor B-like n=1 Tax=Cebidichthys violaceus TaxID=271503 RepID=UPI0035CC5FCD